MKPFMMAAALLAGSAVQPVIAGELTDLIMAPGLFADAGVNGDAILRYDLSRHVPDPAEGVTLPGADRDIAMPGQVRMGQVLLSRDEGDDKLVLAMAVDDTAPATLGRFSASGPNPVLLMFLENVVRSMSVQTGGSPYYIRNRIREALAASGPGILQDGQAVVQLQPFESDPNRARMAGFDGLSLTLRYDPDQPQRLLELMADSGQGDDGYNERLSLIEEE